MMPNLVSPFPFLGTEYRKTIITWDGRCFLVLQIFQRLLTKAFGPPNIWVYGLMGYGMQHTAIE